MSQTITIVLEFEVKMTRPGSPANFYEPAEGPELEIETCSFEGDGEPFETLYKKYKAGKPEGTAVEPFDQFVINEIYNRVLDKAHELDWSEDESDYDPTPD